MNTKDKGDITEAVIIAEFLKLGFSVSIPFGDNERYDLIVDINGDLKKIQCKTARFIDKGYFIFSTCSSDKTGKNQTSDYIGEIDYFAVYNMELNKVYIIPVNEAGKTQCNLRLIETKSNQKKNIRWAKDFEIGEVFRTVRTLVANQLG